MIEESNRAREGKKNIYVGLKRINMTNMFCTYWWKSHETSPCIQYKQTGNKGKIVHTNILIYIKDILVIIII